MPRIQEKIKRYFCAATVGASQQASSSPICSGSITLSQNSYTTHRFKNLATLGCIGIVAALVKFEQVLSKISQVLTDLNKFEQVSAPTFEAIGGAV